MSFNAQPQVPTAQGAPATPSSGQGTTAPQRPAADPNQIALFRAAQSANDRAEHLARQVGQLSQQLGQLTTQQQREKAERDAEAKQADLDRRLESGDLDQAGYTKEVARLAAQQVLADRPAAPAQQAPAQPTAQQTRTIAQNAILSSIGLTGREPGLDFSSPQTLLNSGVRYRQALAAAAQPQQAPGAPAAPAQGGAGSNVNDLLAQLGREQGTLIPHHDGGRAVAVTQPITEQTVRSIAGDKSMSRAQRIAALKETRSALAKGIPAE